MIIVMNNANNQSDDKLNRILKEYSRLPEYSGMGVPAVHTKSLFSDYPINIAAARGILEEIVTLLAHHADINARGEHGYTPLHDAVEQGHIETIKFLLKNGADVTIKNDDGDTPVDLAKLLEEEEIFRFISGL